MEKGRPLEINLPPRRPLSPPRRLTLSRFIAALGSIALLPYTMLSAPMHRFQASETSLAAFAKRYAAAAASITKSGVCLDLERIEAEAVGVNAAREAEGEKGNAEESSGENSEDSSEESSSDDSSSSGEEESSSEEEENAEDNGDESGSNGREGAEKVATTTPRTKEPNATATPHAKPSIDGNQDAITADDSTVLAEEAPGAAAGARGDNRVEETPGSGIRGSVSCGSGSGSARTGSRVERSSDLLDLESRVDNGAGKPASVVADRLSSLSLGKSREPLDSLAEGGQPSGASKGSGGPGARDSRRKNLIQEL